MALDSHFFVAGSPKNAPNAPSDLEDPKFSSKVYVESVDANEASADWIVSAMFPLFPSDIRSEFTDRELSQPIYFDGQKSLVCLTCTDKSFMEVGSALGFRACLTAGTFAGRGLMIQEEKKARFPMQIANMPDMDVCSLRRVRFMYGKSVRDLLRVIVSESNNKSSTPCVIFIENLPAYCRDVQQCNFTGYTDRTAMAMILHHLNEAVEFSARHSKLPKICSNRNLRIIFSALENSIQDEDLDRFKVNKWWITGW